jgi:hypothetical protein
VACTPEATGRSMSVTRSAISGFRRVPSQLRHEELIFHQLKYPHDDADVDIDVIFPIERLHELAAEGVLGGLTDNFFSSIGYNMDPEKFERTLAGDIAEAVVSEGKVDMPMGHRFGVPFHRDLQRRVLFEASKLLETATESGMVRAILIRWAEVRRETKNAHRSGP